jgi:hypothetical protein
MQIEKKVLIFALAIKCGCRSLEKWQSGRMRQWHYCAVHITGWGSGPLSPRLKP